MKYLITVIIAFAALQVISCGKSDEQIAKERTDSVMSVRRGAYDAAQKLVRGQLYVPSSAKFPALAAANTDSLSINIDKGQAVVISYVESQNRMGVYLRPDKFRAVLSGKDSNWSGSVDLPYFGEVGASSNATAPPPPPPPPPPAM
jgi:hypothetical protein